MIGRVIKSKHGTIAIVTNVKKYYDPIYRSIFECVTMDGEPCIIYDAEVIANSVKEYVQNNIDQYLPDMEPSEAAK
jgi:hypothetical protein